MQNPGRRLGLILTLAITLLAGVYLYTPIEQSRLQSPDGRYTALISSQRLWLLLAQIPGLQLQPPALVEILDQNNRKLGKMPVPQQQQAKQLRWIAHGAHIPGVGAWNFQDGFYGYWNRDQSRLIVENI